MGVEGAEGGSTTLEIELRRLVLQGGGNGGSKRESPTLEVEPRRSISQVELGIVTGLENPGVSSRVCLGLGLGLPNSNPVPQQGSRGYDGGG